ncbi:VOC family protein [Phyllobacterium sp. YR531]|uniref:VOC family protein n=1 Tax=Phyllobacterium sp. YR531 TaxID=1144343 RepID=UPI00026F75F5|nr:VOC family protein [Phyllobacterium sp. YR531]EJM98877.1 lactoylglutathione lyase-like lyase [Phyllobacterium sp. YR531]
MPNIENLRKQAKLYLRWHREHSHPVAEQIRLFLPRFRDLTDREILDAEFKLHDAQQLVAGQYGFEDWAALIKGVDAMTKAESPAADAPIILAAEPQIFVSDIAIACQFYVEKLGFQIAFTYGEPPFYAQLFRGGGRLNFRKVSGRVFDSQFRVRERDAISATLTLDNSKLLFLEYQDAGIVFHQALRTEPWGSRTFIVEDPDGNLICFAGK